MTRNYNSILFGLLFMLYSCTHNTKNEKTIEKDSLATDSSRLTEAIVSTINQNAENDTSTILVFDYVKIKLTRLIEYETNNKPQNILGDSCYIIADIGETIFGQKVEVLYSLLTDIKIEQRFETSVSISNEGPHCDLLDWKHYYSNWQTLKKNNNGRYQCSQHPDNKDLKFPEVDRTEFLKKVEKHCGENFVETAYNMSRIAPENVGVSRVYIRITGKYKNRTVTRTIVIEESMGC